jgi:hypothetical protein
VIRLPEAGKENRLNWTSLKMEAYLNKHAFACFLEYCRRCATSLVHVGRWLEQDKYPHAVWRAEVVTT